jgi:hypothetical protein
MQETIKFYVTVRFALSDKLALKTQNVYKMAFFVDFAEWHGTLGTARCAKKLRFGHRPVPFLVSSIRFDSIYEFLNFLH